MESWAGPGNKANSKYLSLSGTGKSETGAHIAYVFAMLNRTLSGEKCVLYCGPSNKAVDVVLSEYL